MEVTDKLTKNRITTFTLSNKDGLDTSIINSIRRIMINEVPTVGFDTETSRNVNIISNNSVLHNEYLEHRIGLIPLLINPSNYNHMDLLFVLRVKVEDTEIREVTTNDIEIYRLQEEKKDSTITIEDFDIQTFKQFYEKEPLNQEEKDAMLNPFIYKNDNGEKEKHYITITRLKKENITSDATEELVFIASPSVNIGKTNARFSHVSQVAYSYTIDQQKADIEKNARISEKGGQAGEEAGKLFDTLDIQKFYKTDSKNRPNSYDIKLESIGILDNIGYFKKSIDILKEKLLNFIENLNTFKQIESGDIQGAIEITVPNEDDTLGNILHKDIVLNAIEVDSPKAAFCSYTKPHPLVDEMVLKLAAEDIEEVLQESVSRIVYTLDEIRNVV